MSSICDAQATQWVDVDGSLYMALRSNACHYWKWAAENAQNFLDKQDLQHQAFLTGDPHHENFSFVYAGQQPVYVLNDFDDVGTGPALLDLIKFIAVSSALYPKKTKKIVGHLLGAFSDGLKDSGSSQQWTEARSVPLLLKKAFNIQPSQLFADYQKKIDKNTENGQFKARRDLQFFENLSQSQQDLFKKLEKGIFLSQLPANYLIKDRAIFSKSKKGGSQGVVRYLYLLSNLSSDLNHIIEFKPIGKTSLSLYHSQQMAPDQRAARAFELFWPKRFDNLFRLVGSGGQAFIMRPKLKKYVNFKTSDLKKDFDDFIDLSEYIAYFLGTVYGRQIDQAMLWAASMEEQQKKLIDQITDFTKAYLKRVQKEHSAK